MERIETRITHRGILHWVICAYEEFKMRFLATLSNSDRLRDRVATWRPGQNCLTQVIPMFSNILTIIFSILNLST